MYWPQKIFENLYIIFWCFFKFFFPWQAYELGTGISKVSGQGLEKKNKSQRRLWQRVKLQGLADSAVGSLQEKLVV